jgi:Mg-chelatase subunit ChlD
MKNYLISALLIGAFSIYACNKRSEQAGKEIDTAMSELEQSSSETGKEAQRKSWPPTSNESVATQTTENYFVVLDDSGSMAGQKMDQAKKALETLADTLAPEHNLGLILLNGSSQVALGTANREEFRQAVASTSANGSTPLSASTIRAFKKITEQASRQQGYGGYHMIIVTDGESSDGSPMDLVKKVVQRTSIQFHVIGFHVATHGMNNPRYVDYRTARNASELAQAFEEVAAETNEFSDPKEFSQ